MVLVTLTFVYWLTAGVSGQTVADVVQSVTLQKEGDSGNGKSCTTQPGKVSQSTTSARRDSTSGAAMAATRRAAITLHCSTRLDEAYQRTSLERQRSSSVDARAAWPPAVPCLAGCSLTGEA